MEPERWNQIQALLADALDRPEEERAAFLASECGDDPELRAEVESLLEAARRGGSYLDRLRERVTPSREDRRAAARRSLERALDDRYRLETLLDEGGMGLVYRALDRKHGRRVAIKTIQPGLGHGVAERFEREIRVTAKLQHPHILPLLDSGVAGDILYYIMPLVEGESLEDRLDREGRLPPLEAVRIVLEIADGLAHAHARGVLHRDIKPSNILLADGHVQIVDFGIARAIVELGPEGLTGTGRGIGTPNYMAPEQFAGESDVRSDVFSLGAVLYEALTCRVWNREAARGEPSWERVPGGLRPALERALEPAPGRRWTTIEDFARALGEWRYTGGTAGRGGTTATRRAGLLRRLLDGMLGRSRPAEADKSIAVLPFENLNRDDETEYFSDGITEDIIANLAPIGELKVISRTSVMRYKGTDTPVREIGRELGVATVLEGSVRRAGDRVRVVSQLIDARTDEQLWSETFDRHLTDIFEIQSEVARRIARALRARITADERSLIMRRPTADVEAHDLYLRGRHLWNRRTQVALEQAEEAFNRAIARDPVFAPAYGGLADVYLLQAGYGYRRELEALKRARTAVDRALKLDERLAEAHASRAQILRADRDWEGEAAGYRRAIELNPNYATAHQWYATLLAALDRPEEARSEIDRALELDPLSHAIRVTSGVIRLVARDYEGALVDFERTIELEPRFFSSYAWLTLLFGELGDYERGVRSWEKLRELHPSPRLANANRSYLAARCGRPDEALERLMDRTDPEHGWAGIVYAQLGMTDQAFALLEKALADPTWRLFLLWRSLVFYIRVGPWFDPLRDDPRFEGLLRHMNMAGAGGRPDV